MAVTHRRTGRLAGGFGFPLGFAAGIVVTTVAVAVGATVHPVLALVALIVATAAVSALTTLTAAVATAVVCWGMYAGFVVGRHGEIVLSGSSATAGLALLVAAVLAVAAIRLRSRGEAASDRR